MTVSSATHTISSRELFFRRSAAYLVDIVLLFAILFPLGWVVVLLTRFTPGSGVQIWQATLLNFSIPAWLYFTLSDSLWGGQTIGKRLFKVKVIGPSDKPPSVPRALLRTAVKLLPWELAHIGGFALEAYPLWQWVCIILSNLLIVIYLAAALASHSRRSIHDWIAHTQVTGAFSA